MCLINNVLCRWRRRGRPAVVFVQPALLGQLLVGRIAAIQPVVLHNEHHVKEDGDEAQAELGEVAKDGVPVVVVVADEEHLEHGEDAAGEVQEDVADAPAHGALSPTSEG